MLSDSASLILSTKSTINPCTINAQKTAFTFNNIDMKNVMGEMWDKYDQFALKLVSFSTEGAITIVSGSTMGQLSYNLRGLEWSNVIYERTGSNMNKEWVPVAFVFLNTVTTNVNPLIVNTGWSFNFKKGNRYENFEFALANTDPNNLNVSSFGVFPAGNNFNDVEFHFLFEPVIPGKMNECAFYGFNSNVNMPGIKRVVTDNSKIYSYPDFNMRRLCNLFWDKHDDFEIQLGMMSMRGTQTNVGDIRITPVQISGLNFVNNGTKQSNDTAGLKLNTENAIIGTVINPNGGSNYGYDMAYAVAPVQFKKDNDNVPLTITFKNSENTGTTNAAGFGGFATPYWQLAFFVKPIYEVEKATLNINPWGLTTTETNLGVRDTDYRTFTLKKIDIRKLCQSFWDKYDRFNIFLTQTTSFTTPSNSSGGYRLEIEGFDFIPQLSLTNTRRQTQVATLGSVSTFVTANEVISNGTMASLVTTFYKTRSIVDLKLTASTLNGAAFPAADTPLKGNFTFTIVGCRLD
jgi:hypothetical protein